MNEPIDNDGNDVADPTPPPETQRLAPPDPHVVSASRGVDASGAGTVNPFRAPQRPLAGFWRRAAAHVLDIVLYTLVVVPFVLVGGATVLTQCSFDANDNAEFTGNAGVAVFGALIAIAGPVAAAWWYLRALAKTGQPWGSSITGLRVVNAAGVPAGWGAALLRTVVACVTGQFAWIGYLWMLGNPEHQTVFDKISRTYVVVDR